MPNCSPDCTESPDSASLTPCEGERSSKYRKDSQQSRWSQDVGCAPTRILTPARKPSVLPPLPQEPLVLRLQGRGYVKRERLALRISPLRMLREEANRPLPLLISMQRKDGAGVVIIHRHAVGVERLERGGHVHEVTLPLALKSVRPLRWQAERAKRSSLLGFPLAAPKPQVERHTRDDHQRDFHDRPRQCARWWRSTLRHSPFFTSAKKQGQPSASQAVALRAGEAAFLPFSPRAPIGLGMRVLAATRKCAKLHDGVSANREAC